MPKRVLVKAKEGALWIKKGLVWIDDNLRWVFLILVFLCVLAMIFGGIWVYNLSQTSNELSKSSKNLSSENTNRINDIQKERENNIRTSCEATNMRHKNAVIALTKIYDRAREAATQGHREFEIPRINASEQATLLVIDAIVPLVDDCEELVKKSTPITGS